MAMKKIINNPDQVVDEMLNGLVFAYDSLVERIPDTMVVHRKAEKNGKVGLVSGGGSGHEPSHAGFVGKGMLSAAVAGQVFTSPTPDQVFEGIKASDEGAGVFLIIKNYTGDVMNFEMAQDLADLEDIKVETIVVDDDIAVEDSTYTAGKRGVAGTVLVHKILGAAAEEGRRRRPSQLRGECRRRDRTSVRSGCTGPPRRTRRRRERGRSHDGTARRPRC